MTKSSFPASDDLKLPVPIALIPYLKAEVASSSMSRRGDEYRRAQPSAAFDRQISSYPRSPTRVS